MNKKCVKKVLHEFQSIKQKEDIIIIITFAI